jgi:RNA polymerase sigma-70 factor (ECF subfamily)
VADTPFSLLDRLTRNASPRDWETFTSLYTPILRGWLRRQLDQEADVDDLVQEVFRVLVARLAEFQHNGSAGAFRAWLRAILVNCLRNFWRARGRTPQPAPLADAVASLDDLADPSNALAQEWDREHDRLVMARLLEVVRPEFTETTWLGFQRYALEGVALEAVAAELGVSVNAVCIAKSRVLRRLREEARGLLGD